jgi:hypothetical protein
MAGQLSRVGQGTVQHTRVQESSVQKRRVFNEGQEGIECPRSHITVVVTLGREETRGEVGRTDTTTLYTANNALHYTTDAPVRVCSCDIEAAIAMHANPSFWITATADGTGDGAKDGAGLAVGELVLADG